MRTLARALFVAAAAALAGPVFAQSNQPPMYTLSSMGWQRTPTATGEVLVCSLCGARVQVQIDVGPVLGPKAPYRTNQQFISLHRTQEQQRSLAQTVLKSQIPAFAPYSPTIKGTGITRLGGIEAVEFVATVDVEPVPSEDTTLLLIHRERVIKLTLNFFEGSLSDKARALVDALLASIRFQ